MPELTGKPLVTKYTPGDEVYLFNSQNMIEKVLITEWKVVVDNPLSDSTGRQTTYYKFYGKDFELPESLVFSSENHLLGWLKQDFLNRAIESGTGAEAMFNAGCQPDEEPLSFGSWTDFGGFDLKLGNFRNVGDVEPEINVDWVTEELIFDGARLFQARMPTDLDTKAKFRAEVKSYDAETTLWVDNGPIGRP